MTEAELLADIESLGWSVDGTVNIGSYQFWDRKQAQCSRITGDVIELRNFDYILPEGAGPEDPARYLGQNPGTQTGYDAIVEYLDGLVVAETIFGYTLEHVNAPLETAIVRILLDGGNTVDEQRSFVHREAGNFTFTEVVPA